ncbi:hypothetical protein O1W68_07725 [Rhodococcus sp. H36-A4]|uniref:hypothetical protein n=1 Tax=Rhodococcus sp. H36-A4 TaxID=3004353 RepID=UPI0022AF4C3B|nr:hypothetical protein [Rhodococcus sp. H36-A4]MCZ4077824.1 hypothetical protein [Rhodococcus sp. H36-A4]
MSSKISVRDAIVEHFDTLIDDATGKRHFWDYFLLYLMPIAGGILVAWIPVNLKSVGDIIAGVSILTALLFGLIIYVFQLRLQVAADPRIVRGGVLMTLLDQLFANLIYAVIIGLGATVLAVSASASADSDGSINPWWSALVVTAGSHLVLTILMCLKRTRDAYAQLTI